MKIEVEPELLRPLIAEVVAQTLKRLRDEEGRVNGRFAYTEAEAADLLGLEQHVLRDERRRGRITASCGPGRRILYTPEDLTEYLAARRIKRNAEG